MLRTIEATIDEQGKVTLNEQIKLAGRTRALVTLLDEPAENPNEPYLLAESALQDWNRPEEDEAWKHLADLPALEDDK